MTLKLPPPLSAQDRSSFAYKTIKDRLPVILVKVIDYLYKLRNTLKDYPDFVDPAHVEDAQVETKLVIGMIAKLRKELETNKSIELFETMALSTTDDYDDDDIQVWNSAIKDHSLSDGSLPKWFESPWLLMECYMYRKLKECFLKTNHLKRFDPFVEQKRAATKGCLLQMSSLADYLMNLHDEFGKLQPNTVHPNERKLLNLFIQLSLWANKADLSLSGMNHEAMSHNKHDRDIIASVDKLASNILCDNLSEVWFKLQSIIKNFKTKSTQDTNTFFIDIVADNSGYELFMDLCLMQYITMLFSSQDKSPASNSRLVLRLHVKQMPWFVSDVNKHDIDWLLSYLDQDDKTENLRLLAKLWNGHLEEKRWLVVRHKFWTLPHDFSQMKSVCTDLHSQLEQSSLIVFKGDLNYRKLTGDLRWNILVPFKTALRGFQPAPLVALRTCKADVVVGIENMEIYAKITNNQLPSDWMISGDYGLIQFAQSL